MDPLDQVAAQQRRALDFMLDALNLTPVCEDTERLARLFAAEQVARGLIRENRQLRQRVTELEHAVHPADAELEALAREADRLESAGDQPTDEAI